MVKSLVGAHARPVPPPSDHARRDRRDDLPSDKHPRGPRVLPPDIPGPSARACTSVRCDLQDRQTEQEALDWQRDKVGSDEMRFVGKVDGIHDLLHQRLVVALSGGEDRGAFARHGEMSGVINRNTRRGSTMAKKRRCRSGVDTVKRSS